MRILLAHNYYQLSGGEDFVFEQERSLLASHNQHVETYTVSNNELRGTIDKVKTFFNVAYSNSAKDRFKKKIIEFNPDIVHVHNFFPILTPAIYDACIEMQKPVVQTLHNYRITCAAALLLRKEKICEKCVNGTPYNGWFYRCYRNSFWGSLIVAYMINFHRKRATWNNKVNKLIVLTEFARRKFIETGIQPEKLVVKSNFCEYQDKNKTAPIPDKKPYALYVGRLSHEKGINTLKAAWRDLNIPLHVVGDGPMFSSFQSDKSDAISLLGYLSPERVRQEMQKASFLIMPSEWYEGFPLTIVEAFSCSLPVLTTNIGSMAEIVEPNKTGVLFSPGKADELAAKVKWLHSHLDECIRMGRNAYNIYLEKYSPAINYEMLIKIYTDTIHLHKSSI